MWLDQHYIMYCIYQGGPGARSGHCMCYDEKRRVLYVTGRYTASVSMFELHQPQVSGYGIGKPKLIKLLLVERLV